MSMTPTYDQCLDELSARWPESSILPPLKVYIDSLATHLLEPHEHPEDARFRLKTRYKFETDMLVSQFEQTDFWKVVTAEVANLDATYEIDHGCRVVAASTQARPTVVAKPFDSQLEKSYRLNVLTNSAWPRPPHPWALPGTQAPLERSWVTPDNWYERVRDVVRTQFLVKYLDAAKLVSDVIDRVAADSAEVSDTSFEARDEGYYAIHNVIVVPLSLPGPGIMMLDKYVHVELQVSTQVQEVIRQFTHKVYESRRMRIPDPSKKWQWEWKNEEFVPNYLGHILHYVEGMIMDVRDKQKLQEEGASH